MRLFSYVVARDYGFAPNPFHGYCTLATCKPRIRAAAEAGDWVIGTGSANYGLRGHLIYAMRVGEALTYDQYWEDERFRAKRPVLNRSLKYAYGDNIYHRHPVNHAWQQANSHHSLPNGEPNPLNLTHDTQVSRVLIGSDFYYWGANGPEIPPIFRNYDGIDICMPGVGHKYNFPDEMVAAFIRWLRRSEETGFISAPSEFLKHK